MYLKNRDFGTIQLWYSRQVKYLNCYNYFCNEAKGIFPSYRLDLLSHCWPFFTGRIQFEVLTNSWAMKFWLQFWLIKNSEKEKVMNVCKNKSMLSPPLGRQQDLSFTNPRWWQLQLLFIHWTTILDERWNLLSSSLVRSYEWKKPQQASYLTIYCKHGEIIQL